MTPQQLAALAMKCGLKVSTVDDLLRRGWSYVEVVGKPQKWVSPVAKLRHVELKL